MTQPPAPKPINSTIMRNADLWKVLLEKTPPMKVGEGRGVPFPADSTRCVSPSP